MCSALFGWLAAFLSFFFFYLKLSFYSSPPPTTSQEIVSPMSDSEGKEKEEQSTVQGIATADNKSAKISRETKRLKFASDRNYTQNRY
jgi:hypothetical protein